MKRAGLMVLYAGLIVLGGCVSLPVAPAATEVAATMPTAVASAAAVQTEPAPTSEPVASPTPLSQTVATTVPAATVTRPATSTPVRFTTHHDPEAGFAIDYPADWFITVPPAELRQQVASYTASLRSESPVSDQPRGGPFPPGTSGVDVTVEMSTASTFDEAVRERRDAIANNEIETRIVSEEIWTLAGGLRAVRWQLENSATGVTAELTTLLGGNRIMVSGMGDLTGFDAIARSLRAEEAPPGTALTYTDAPLGFTLSLPADWEMCQDTGQSRLFCERRVELGAAAFPRFYLTVLPLNFANEDFSAYNFFSEEDVQALMALAVGESYTVDGAPGYSTFTRLPDTTVDGRSGVVVENSTVWEGGANTRDRRVLVKVATSIYMFGAYCTTEAELAEFERVLAGVTITGL